MYPMGNCFFSQIKQKIPSDDVYMHTHVLLNLLNELNELEKRVTMRVLASILSLFSQRV